MRCRSRSLVVLACLLFVAAIVLAVPDPATCRKTALEPPVFDFTQLPELAGGAVHLDCVSNIPWKFLKYNMCGQTREIGGPWQACVWTYAPAPGTTTLETLASLDPTKDAGANACGVVIFDPAQFGEDSTFVACGYSYDALSRIQPMCWSRGTSAIVWTATQLPTLMGLEGEALGFACPQGDTDCLIVGWSTGAATNKAVIWTTTGSSSWAVRSLPHDGPGYAGCALDGKGGDLADTVLVGWTESASGDTIPAVWENNGGGWTKTNLPLLPAGTRGMAMSIIGEQANDLVGWAENSSGQSRAVRWYYDGGWQIQELDQLASYSQSVGLSGEEGNDIIGEEANDIVVVGRSYDPDPPVATIWGLTADEGNDFTRDLNDLVVTDDPPVLREATGIYGDPHIVLITANGVAAGQPGGYSISQSGPPHAYVLAEVELVPAMSSNGLIALLALVPAAAALLWIARRRRRSPAEKV